MGLKSFLVATAVGVTAVVSGLYALVSSLSNSSTASASLKGLQPLPAPLCSNLQRDIADAIAKKAGAAQGQVASVNSNVDPKLGQLMACLQEKFEQLRESAVNNGKLKVDQGKFTKMSELFKAAVKNYLTTTHHTPEQSNELYSLLSKIRFDRMHPEYAAKLPPGSGHVEIKQAIETALGAFGGVFTKYMGAARMAGGHTFSDVFVMFDLSRKYDAYDMTQATNNLFGRLNKLLITPQLTAQTTATAPGQIRPSA